MREFRKTKRKSLFKRLISALMSIFLNTDNSELGDLGDTITDLKKEEGRIFLIDIRLPQLDNHFIVGCSYAIKNRNT